MPALHESSRFTGLTPTLHEDTTMGSLIKSHAKVIIKNRLAKKSTNYLAGPVFFRTFAARNKSETNGYTSYCQDQPRAERR